MLSHLAITLRYDWALPLLFLLPGCPATPICVEATDKRASSLTLEFVKGRNCVDSPEVISIQVIRESDRKTLWRIQSSSSGGDSPKRRQLNGFTYGIVPEGFEESNFRFTKLRSGETITIFVDGYPTVTRGEITLTLD